MTTLKHNKVSVNLLLIAGVIIYSVSAFYPWSDILFHFLSKFIDVENEAAVEALFNVALSPLIVFIIWLIVAVILNIILKLIIKPSVVPADIKDDEVKRMRAVMNFIRDNSDNVKQGYSLLDKKFIKKDELQRGVSFAAIIPFIAAVLYIIITVARSYFEFGVDDDKIFITLVVAVLFAVINLIPNLITIRIVSRLNIKLSGFKKSDDYDILGDNLFNHMLCYWWYEIDEERKRECDMYNYRRQKEKEEFATSMANIYLQEQKEAAERTARFESWMRGE